MKGNFREGAWKDVSRATRSSAIPVDGGPMGMIYRTDVFKKYQITPPTTWDQYAATAQKLKDAEALNRRPGVQRAGVIYGPAAAKRRRPLRLRPRETAGPDDQA